MRKMNNLYYRITVDDAGELVSVESKRTPDDEFVKINDKQLEALEGRDCTKATLESHGKIKTIRSERRARDADVQ